MTNYKKLDRAIEARQLAYVNKAEDNNRKSIIRRLVYRLGMLVYKEAPQEEVDIVKSLIRNLLQESGEYWVESNVSKLLLGGEDLDNTK